MSEVNEINDWVQVVLFPGISNPRAAGFRFYGTEAEAVSKESMTTTYWVMPWDRLPDWVQGKLGALNTLVLDKPVKHVKGVGGKAADMLWVEYDDPQFEREIKKVGVRCGKE